MKRIILSFTFILASIFSAHAQQQDTTLQSIKGEGIEYINTDELPEDVRNRFESGDYQDATIEEAYILKGDALTEVVGQEAMEYYIGGLPPEKLYVISVTQDETHAAILYYTEDGEIYASQDIEM